MPLFILFTAYIFKKGIKSPEISFYLCNKGRNSLVLYFHVSGRIDSNSLSGKNPSRKKRLDFFRKEPTIFSANGNDRDRFREIAILGSYTIN